MTHDDRSSNKVTLEDLLRLKRAERPAAEFWVQFERDLRAKQLAAIVEKRPWWYWAPPLMAKVSRLQVPLGAAAVLTVTLLTVREYRSTGQQQIFVEPVSHAQVTAAVQQSSAPVAVNALPAETSQQSAPVAVEPAQSVSVAAVSAAPSISPTPAQVSAAVGMLNNDDSAAYVRMASSPSSRAIEANLAAAKASDGDIAEMVDGLSGFESRVMPANARIEPLAQMQSPSEQRRSRILASALPAVSYGADRMGESRSAGNSVRKIDDDRLYDSISRMAVGGDRLTLKF